MESPTPAQPPPPSNAPGMAFVFGERAAPFRWLAGLALITLGSWGRYLATGSLRVDENYPAELPGSILYLVLLTGWILAVSGWVAFLRAPPARPRRLAYAGVAAVALMLPMLSNDLYGLFAYAELAVHGHDVFTNTLALPLSPWFVWMGERWRDNPCPYGPIGLLATAWPATAGARAPFLAVFLLRATWLVPLVAVMELTFRAFRDRPFFHAMLWLNPLILVEGVGQQHPDLLGCLAITAGLVAQSRGPRVLGALGWAAATLCKWNDVLVAPWFWLARARSWGQRAKSLAIMALVLVGLTTAAYLPFWRGSETLREPFRALFSQTIVPGGSVVDVIGELGYSISKSKEDFDPSVPVVERVAHQRATRAPYWRMAQSLMWILTLAALIPLLWRTFLRRDDDRQIALATGMFIVIVLTLASPKFQSWYFMTSLPFFGLCCPPAWRKWWPWVIFAAVAQELPLALPRDALLFMPAVGLSTGGSAVVFLWSFRKRFWRTEDLAEC